MLDRVPYEIFSKVIKFSYRYSFISDYNFDDNETSLPPFEATRVCRSWRNTLLRDPTMWTTIRIKYTESNPNELANAISLSGSMPLDVFIEKGDHSWISDNSALELITLVLQSWVLPEMHRIRKFQALLPLNIAGAVLALLIEPAPILQMFHFESEEGGESEIHFVEDELLTPREAFDQNLLFDNAPVLEHIHLPISSGFTELQSISFFRNLSRIHLQFVSYTAIEGDLLLNILQNSSPNLRVLNLIWSHVEPNITCSMASHHRISLPHLQELSLRGTCPVDDINFVLERLDFPVDKVNLDITCVDFYPAPYGLATSLMDFQRRLLLLSISESPMEDMIINFSKQTSDMDLESPTSNSYSSGNPIFRTLLMRSVPRYYLRNLFPNNTGMANITHVCLEDYLIMDIPMFRKLLESLPNAQYFRIYHGSRHEGLQASSGGISDSYLKALIPPRWVRTRHRRSDFKSETNNEASQVVHSPPCPSLHTLQLVFRGKFLEFDSYYISALVRFFKFREEVGHPLKSIIIWHEYPSLINWISEEWLQVPEFESFRNAVEFRLVEHSTGAD